MCLLNGDRTRVTKQWVALGTALVIWKLIRHLSASLLFGLGATIHRLEPSDAASTAVTFTTVACVVIPLVSGACRAPAKELPCR